MDSRIVNRIGGGGGLLYVVLVFLGVALAGGTPELGASYATIEHWAETHDATTITWVGAALEATGIFFFVAFLARLWGVLRSGARDASWLPTAALAAGLVSVAVKLASFPPTLVAFYRGRELDPQLGALLVDMNNVAFVLTWGIDAAFLAFVCAAVLVSRALPAWLGWGAAVSAVAALAAIPLATGGGGQSLSSVWILWLVAASIVLVRRSSPAPSGTSSRVGLPDPA